MSTLAARLKALAKALGQGKEPPPEVLQRLEACLDEIDKVLPPAQRGRPKKRDLALHMLRFYVDGIKALPDSGIETDKEALQRLLRQRLIVRGSLKTLQHKLAQARKASR